MKKRAILAFTVVAAIIGPSIASAQMGLGRGGTMMMGGMMDRDCPMMGMMTMGQEARQEQRLAAVKTQIGIKPEQEAAWTAYAAAAKKNLDAMQGAHRSMQQSMQAKTPLERLDAHVTAVESRAATLKAMKPALTTLYDALSAEQKTKANAVLSGAGCMM